MKHISIDALDLHQWFERDRACVELRDHNTGQTVFELWDEDCQQAFEDGFLDMRCLKQSAYEYAQHLGIIA